MKKLFIVTIVILTCSSLFGQIVKSSTDDILMATKSDVETSNKYINSYVNELLFEFCLDADTLSTSQQEQLDRLITKAYNQIELLYEQLHGTERVRITTMKQKAIFDHIKETVVSTRVDYHYLFKTFRRFVEKIPPNAENKVSSVEITYLTAMANIENIEITEASHNH